MQSVLKEDQDAAAELKRTRVGWSGNEWGYGEERLCIIWAISTRGAQRSQVGASSTDR